MAVRQRENSTDRGSEREDLAEVVALAVRVLCRLVIAASPGQFSASFREIAVGQARVATHAEVDVIEQFLAEHPPGS